MTVYTSFRTRRQQARLTTASKLLVEGRFREVLFCANRNRYRQLASDRLGTKKCSRCSCLGRRKSAPCHDIRRHCWDLAEEIRIAEAHDNETLALDVNLCTNDANTCGAFAETASQFCPT